jgi:hypothetical protein
MAKYGKIYIEASSIEEAERDLEMIKALAKAGAVKGQGSSALGMASAEIVGKPTAKRDKCYGCDECCCRECGCDWDYEGDEVDPYDEIADIITECANGYIGPHTALERITDIIADLV